MKIGNRLKKIIGTVAPLLGGALGGPLGGLAGKAIQDALGVDSEEAALKMLETDPESLIKLKQAEMQFEERMRELDISEDKLHAEDRSSARDLGKARGVLFQMVLSGLFIIGYFGMMYVFFSGKASAEITEWGRGQVGVLIGILTAAIPQILAYWFGSSSGSKTKTDALVRAGEQRYG